jgi:hypothetical protein
MARIIAALFTDAARAEGALRALMTAGLSGQRTALIGGETRATELGSFQASSAPDAAQLAAIPADDRPLFEEGLRRGGSVLLADIAGDVEQAVRIVETFEPTEIEGPGGGRGQDARGPQGGVDVGAPLGAGLTGGMGQGNTNLESMPGAGTMADDTSTLGTADLRTDEMGAGDQGRSTGAVGGRRSEERAGAPGVRELGRRVRSYGT